MKQTAEREIAGATERAMCCEEGHRWLVRYDGDLQLTADGELCDEAEE